MNNNQMTDNQTSTIENDMPDDLDTRYLLFFIDGMLYGVSLALVLEIIQVQNITQLPNVSSHISGIINLRGKVIPVVDVRTKFGLPDVPPTDKTCIVVVEYNENTVGLVVDSVSEVATFANAKLSPPPESANFSNRYLSSIAELTDKVVLNIDFESFFHDDIY